MILAKPVIPDHYWILRDAERKIGNIEADAQGYNVRINNNTLHFKTLDMVRERVGVAFEMPMVSASNAPTNSVHGYPTNGVSFNGVWDVKRQLPLWTQEERSKSWLAAGWYRVRQHRDWQVIFCPKLILLDRYEYQGPFLTEIEARS